MGPGTICVKCKVQVLVMFHLLAQCDLPYVSTRCVLPKIFTAKPWYALHGCDWILTCKTLHVLSTMLPTCLAMKWCNPPGLHASMAVNGM